MAWGYLILVVIGIGMIVAGFYGAYVRKCTAAQKTLFSVLMPAGLIVTLLGIVLTVLPNFFKETIW